MVEKSTKIKKLLHDKKTESNLVNKIPQTRFEKPSKKRKRMQSVPKTSSTESEMLDMVIRGTIDEGTPTEEVDNKTVIMKWFLWSEISLRSMKKNDLAKLAKEYDATNSSSATKHELIQFLLDNKEA